MKVAHIFEFKTVKDGTRDLTASELQKVDVFCRKKSLELGSARRDDKTGDVYVSATNKLKQVTSFVLDKNWQPKSK